MLCLLPMLTVGGPLGSFLDFSWVFERCSGGQTATPKGAVTSGRPSERSATRALSVCTEGEAEMVGAPGAQSI